MVVMSNIKASLATKALQKRVRKRLSRFRRAVAMSQELRLVELSVIKGKNLNYAPWQGAAAALANEKRGKIAKNKRRRVRLWAPWSRLYHGALDIQDDPKRGYTNWAPWQDADEEDDGMNDRQSLAPTAAKSATKTSTKEKKSRYWTVRAPWRYFGTLNDPKRGYTNWAPWQDGEDDVVEHFAPWQY